MIVSVGLSCYVTQDIIVERQHNQVEFRQVGHVLLTPSTIYSQSKLYLLSSHRLRLPLQWKASSLWPCVHYLCHSAPNHLVRVNLARTAALCRLGNRAGSLAQTVALCRLGNRAGSGARTVAFCRMRTCAGSLSCLSSFSSRCHLQAKQIVVNTYF